MVTESSDHDFQTINKLNFNKISHKLGNMGYKDGMHDGRESQFQNGFDIGFENGFRNGFLLGKYKGSLRDNSQATGETSKLNIQNDLILQRPSRGQCILCTDSSLSECSIGEVVDKQSKYLENVKNTLESRYGPQ